MAAILSTSILDVHSGGVHLWNALELVWWIFVFIMVKKKLNKKWKKCFLPVYSWISALSWVPQIVPNFAILIILKVRFGFTIKQVKSKSNNKMKHCTYESTQLDSSHHKIPYFERKWTEGDFLKTWNLWSLKENSTFLNS